VEETPAENMLWLLPDDMDPEMKSHLKHGKGRVTCQENSAESN